jgi:Zn-dependent metalloprotease
MKKMISAALLLTATMAFAKNPASESKINIKDSDAKGVPTFVTGELGQLGAGASGKAAKDFLMSQRALLGGAGTEDFEAIGTAKDNFGHTHVRLQQRLRGLPVIGAEYIVHADGDGKVYAMNGRFAPDNDLPRNPSIDGWSALARAASQAGIANGRWQDVRASLVYVVTEKSAAYLAWRATVEYVDAEGEQRDEIYADAGTGDLVLRDAKIHRARNRATYNGNNTSSLPGTLVLSETSGSTSDSVISTAHAHAATSYDYYFNVHGRDSFNNAGAQIKTTVHHQVNYNNAFWNGTQLVYGDGDGTTFSPLGNSLDVGAHELTHAVTTYSANLTYSNESGALNEGTSDIMAAAVEAWKRGVVDANTWKVGEDIYTPGTAGDALRYMDNPTADGSSKDYYPERYVGTSDNGGVHWNSGIANLAFKLMVTGGSHPRAKTTTVVPALNATGTTSMNMAAKIWYRALTVYMTSSTNFAGAKTATATAATDLYGAAAADSVNMAWEAVGVGGTTGGGTVTLTNGVAVSSIGASTGAWKHYKIAVPSGQSKLDIVMSGGTGDADMYVKRGSQPTLSSYDYRPYLSGNAESVSVTNPVAGDWYISLYAYSTFSGVTLKATYTGTTTPSCTSVSGSLSGTGANYYTTSYTSSVSGSHTGKLTGPSGTDFDLYLQKWNGSSWAIVARGETSTSTESVTYSGTSGSYRWRVYSYSGSGSFTLCTTKP